MAISRGGVKMTSRQQAAYVRELTGWTREEYNRKYDVLRNRVRAYERGSGLQRGSINVADLLARDARSRAYAKYYGEAYTPTALYAAVQAAPATSSGRRLSARQRAAISDAQEERAYNEMGGIIRHSKYSAEIAAEVERLKGLGAYSGRVFYALVRSYARRMDRERREIALYNSSITDFAAKMFFHS